MTLQDLTIDALNHKANDTLYNMNNVLQRGRCATASRLNNIVFNEVFKPLHAEISNRAKCDGCETGGYYGIESVKVGDKQFCFLCNLERMNPEIAKNILNGGLIDYRKTEIYGN